MINWMDGRIHHHRSVQVRRYDELLRRMIVEVEVYIDGEKVTWYTLLKPNDVVIEP